MIPRLLCFGMGYVAEHLSTELREQGWQVIGTCRTQEKCSTLEAQGFEMHVFPSKRMTNINANMLSSITHILISVPPDTNGDPVLRAIMEIVPTLSNLVWSCYLSTTGVYGDHDGEWVAENAKLSPSSDVGKRRILAEKQWLAMYTKHAVPVHIFRLAGIYGPGRNQLDRVRSGRAQRIIRKGLFLSRVHVDDITGLLRSSISRPDPGAIYNVADDEPAPPQDVVNFACELLGVKPPLEVPYEELELSTAMARFYRDRKKVSNKQIKDKLGYEFRYKSYREGLRALLEES